MRYTITFRAEVETLDAIEETMENADTVLEGMLAEVTSEVFEITTIRNFEIVPILPNDGEG